jgi:hypothetical protein
VGAHRALGLLSEILGDLGDEGRAQRVWQRFAEQSQKTWLSHQDQVIETIVASRLLEFRDYFLGEDASLVFARASLTTRRMVCSGTATATDKWCVVEYTSWPVGFEIPVMQVGERIGKPPSGLKGTLDMLYVVEGCLGLTRNDNSDTHSSSLKARAVTLCTAARAGRQRGWLPSSSSHSTLMCVTVDFSV